ncbi:MAG: outer membrane protein assembly factor BamA [Cytophagales bacterium]|nr:MAG: outer membrane protein assembly factor BamA [Cytophagales bacterium]
MRKIVFIILSIIAPLLVQAQKIGLGYNKNRKIEVDYAKPQDYIIGGITVVGSEFLDRNALLNMCGLKEGDKIKIPSEETSNVVRKLWKSGIIGDAKLDITKVEGDKVFLEISVKERPRLSRTVFEGVRKGQQETLNDKIKLVKGKIINESMMKVAENKIRNHYAEKGFKNAKVLIVPQKDTLLARANQAYLKINIDKGSKVKISKIEMEGVSAFPEKTIKRKLKKTKEKRFGRIFSPSKFTQKEFDKDKDNVLSFYNKNGYRNASIDFDSVFDVNEELVGIKIKIDEGKKFYYRNIKWVGNTVYSDTILGQVLGISKGDVYDPEDMSKRLNYSPTSSDVTSLYMDDGYLFFNVEPVEVQVDEDSIDIEMRIFEGEQANINKINLRGNTRTSDHVIHRELRTVPGAKFSRSDIIRTQREIAALNYFDPEKIAINPAPNMSEGTVDINYGVEERPSDQIELSGGWGGYFGFVGTVGLVLNNFSMKKFLKFKDWRGIPQGDGQKLALRVQANGRRFQNYSITFTEPWLGGNKPNGFTVAVNHSVSRTITATNQVLGSLQITGINTSLMRRLTFPDDWFVMSNSLGYQHYNLNNFIQGGIGSLGDGKYNSITFNTTISRNSIDNVQFPRSGSTVSLSMNFTPPYSLLTGQDLFSRTSGAKWVEYYKWMFDNTWYQQIVGKLVIAARAHMGLMGAYNKSVPISPFERFVLGGSGMTFNNFLLGTEIISLRGYQDQSVIPLQSDGNGALIYKSTNSGGQGGIIYNKFVLEMRYPLSLAQSATIFVLGFAEGGNNWARFADFNPFDLKRSAGVGARIFMPAFGMLGIDWAYGFDQVPGATGVNGGQFHFTIGQPVR